MVRVCAWCHRYLGIKHSHQGGISHGICAPCAARQRWEETPVLVVSPELRHVVPVLEELLRGKPEIRIVLERRTGDRRGSADRRKSASAAARRAERRGSTRSRRRLYLTRESCQP
jgi:hypothetical protein